MARSIEVEGKTIDEAIFAGLERLKLSFDEVEIFILDEGSKGFLGIGNKLSRVRLEEREEELVMPKEAFKPTNKPAPKPFERRESNSRPPQRNNNNSYQSSTPKNDFHREQRSPATIIQGPYFSEGTVFVENEATAFLKGLLDKMGLKGTVNAAMVENALLINIEGENMGALIGYRGETLDSIQYLCSLIFNKGKEEYTRVTLDTENYRKKREQTLVRLAGRLAENVRHSKNKVALEPMNPFERRVIHFALQNDKYVTTFSEGDEPNRRVIIAPK